jgi:6-methylsalicylate decarboxylase
MSGVSEGHSRRRFLQGAASAAAGAGVAAAVTAPAHAHDRPRRPVAKIDVHAHYLPADYRQALIDNGQAQPDGFPVLPTWSPAAHLAMMDQIGITTSMLSVSSPGVTFGVDAASWARRVNETGAATVRRYPERFGLFATLPLPDVDAALDELRHAFDSLKADGVVLLTNFDEVYLGDSRFEPVFAELNRRKAVAFIHPTSPACFEKTSLGYPRPVLEFLLDTTRAVANMVLNGTLTKYADIRLIVPHSGAALPVVADRLAGFAGLFPLGGHEPKDIDVLGTLQRLYYEVGAGFPFPRQISALLDLVDAGRLLYGTDFPFGAVAGIEANAHALETTKLLKRRELDGVLSGNARRLFSRLGRADTRPTRGAS